MRSCDAIVVGAGPAGAAAAIGLARRGLDVVVADRARFPRDKICGDGLTSLALEELESLGLDPGDVASWCWTDTCRVRSPSGRTALFPLPRGNGHHAAIATRADLDGALVELARKEGAEVREGAGVLDVREGGTEVEVDLDGAGTVRSPWLVAADGMWSPTRKMLGLGEPGYRGEWHAFRQYFSDVGPVAATDMVVAFEADILPGYFWSFPLPGRRANVGFGIQRGAKVAVGDMKAVWQDILRRPHIREILGEDARAEGTPRAWPIPARIDTAPLVGRRTLFVGDAAAACDVLTGEGIGQALLTGRRAAEALAASGRSGDAPTHYAHRVRADLVADHRMSALLVRALRHRKGARAAVRVAGASAWTRRNFARWLFEDYPRAVLLTPRRWERGMLTGPGSYART